MLQCVLPALASLSMLLFGSDRVGFSRMRSEVAVNAVVYIKISAKVLALNRLRYTHTHAHAHAHTHTHTQFICIFC